MNSGTWRPWRELRDREHIFFELADLPDGMNALLVRDPCSGTVVILMSKRLDPAERLAAMAHELVHDERGGSGHADVMPAAWAPVVAREEARVDRIVAERVLPVDVLADWVEREVDLGHQVDVQRTAEHFEVATIVAARTLEALQRLSA